MSKEIQKLNSNIEQLLQKDEKPLSFTEASDYLDVSKSHLYKLTHKKAIKFFKPNGKKIYFKKTDLNNWLFRNESKTENEIEQEALEYVVSNSEVI